MNNTMAYRIATAGFLVASAAPMYWGFQSTPMQPTRKSVSAKEEKTETKIPSFAGVLDKQLQGPPIPEKSKEAATKQTKTVTVKLPPSLKLESILYSKSKQLAVFSQGNNQSICGIGEQVSSASVKSISKNDVTLVYRGQDFKLEVQ